MTVHALLARQIAAATDRDGVLDVDTLLSLIDMAYVDHDRDRVRTDRAARVMSEEVEELVAQLQTRNETLRQARRDAEAASEAKSAFLANMSHEIRTPLNGVMGMARVLSGSDLSEQQRDFVTTIVESSENLMAILNDVLDLSKIEAGKVAITPTDTDLGHVLRRVQRLWSPRADEKGLRLALTLDAGLPHYVRVDAARIQQCVSNLVSNAIKFTETGTVSVQCRADALEDGDFLIHIEVSDTGCGIDEEALARLFTPFTQADDSTSRRYGGTGLGLSITKRLAELMGGGASARSAPGEGATFAISFRAERVAGQYQPQAAPAPGPSTDVCNTAVAPDLRILLVDDNDVNRKVVILFLRSLHAHIVEVSNGQEALDALEREPFDLVLLDMHMPVMDGPTAVARIRGGEAPYRAIPIIALTADAMSGDRERYLGMGMDGYLPKPLEEQDLLDEIHRLTGGDAQGDRVAS